MFLTPSFTDKLNFTNKIQFHYLFYILGIGEVKKHDIKVNEPSFNIKFHNLCYNIFKVTRYDYIKEFASFDLADVICVWKKIENYKIWKIRNQDLFYLHS